MHRNDGQMLRLSSAVSLQHFNDFKNASVAIMKYYICLTGRLVVGSAMLTHPVPPTAKNSKYCHPGCYFKPRSGKRALFDSMCKRCKQQIPRDAPIDNWNGKWVHAVCSELGTPPTPMLDFAALAEAARIFPGSASVSEPLSFESKVSALKYFPIM